MAMPTSRTRLEMKERGEQFNGSGETTSHFRSMSGVKLTSRMSLPKISAEDKKRIFVVNPDVLPKKWRDAVSSGEPLFWQETKSKELWVQMIGDLQVTCVVDATPGSGCLAVACMEKGIPYFGMCRDATHLAWLGNVLDRVALSCVCAAGTHLYQEDLAVHVKELFSEMLKNSEDEVSDEILAMSDDE